HASVSKKSTRLFGHPSGHGPVPAPTHREKPSTFGSAHLSAVLGHVSISKPPMSSHISTRVLPASAMGGSLDGGHFPLSGGDESVREDADGIASMAVQVPSHTAGASNGIPGIPLPGQGAWLAVMIGLNVHETLDVEHVHGAHVAAGGSSAYPRLGYVEGILGH